MDLENLLAELKPIDLTPLILQKDKVEQQKISKVIIENFHKYGIVIVKDPRVPFNLNNDFMDMMEDYFNLKDEEKVSDIRADHAFQVGVTPSFTEVPRNHCPRIETLDPNHKPLTPCPPEADPKWRFFWTMAEAKGNDEENEAKNQFAILNLPNVIPKNFPTWEQLCNQWGNGLLATGKTISEGLALGFDLPRNYFTSRMSGAPNLVAPTGSDLIKHGKLNTVLAGYHYDLNFLSLHGKSRYPGLYVWLRDGRKVLVKVPEGCLLCQAAKQLEWLTGGYIFAGFHEVVVCEETLKAIERQKKLNRPLWRISSTMFCHMRSNVILEPINKFKNELTSKKYPPIAAGKQVLEELAVIKLHSNL